MQNPPCEVQYIAPLEVLCKGFLDISYENALFLILKDSISKPAITCSKLTIETLEQKCGICSKLTIKPPKRRQRSHIFKQTCSFQPKPCLSMCDLWRRFSGFIVNFEHIPHFCPSVSIFKFEHVIAGWDDSATHLFLDYICILVCRIIFFRLMNT